MYIKNTNMKKIQNDNNFRAPVIDVSATSKKLKTLREQHCITIAEIQKMFGMENPQSIYTWENPKSKILPRLDNLISLAKIYKVSLDEMIIIKEDDFVELTIKEPRPAYGISSETIDFIHNNTSERVHSALVKYFGFSL